MGHEIKRKTPDEKISLAAQEWHVCHQDYVGDKRNTDKQRAEYWARINVATVIEESGVKND